MIKTSLQGYPQFVTECFSSENSLTKKNLLCLATCQDKIIKRIDKLPEFAKKNRRHFYNTLLSKLFFVDIVKRICEILDGFSLIKLSFRLTQLSNGVDFTSNRQILMLTGIL